MISAASGCAAPWGEKARISGRRPLSRASAMILNPSARNRPSSRRAFLSRSERIRLTVSLENAVTCLGTASIFPESLFDQLRQLRQGRFRADSGDVDRDAVVHGRAEHHQAHDRGAADLVAVLFDLD